jgi:hypothetical protein
MQTKEQAPLNFQKGKVPRNELELPTLYFVTMDQWLDVIGEKALLAWLRMYTWAKRNDVEEDVNPWEQAIVPNSFNKLIKKLGVGRDTFYNKILKPLWNVGLIDIVEYKDSVSEGNKPMNIIVYKYPQNNITLAHQELKIIRDYDKDYQSNAKTFAKKGGRPKKQENEDKGNDDKRLERGGSQIEPRVVPEQNQGGFSNRTRGGSQIEPNNITNTNNNSLNNINNTLNGISNSLKLVEEEEENIIKEIEKNPFYMSLMIFLHKKNASKELTLRIIKECINQNLYEFRMNDYVKQFDYMAKEIEYGVSYGSFEKYFVNGLKDKTEQSFISKKHMAEEKQKMEEKIKRSQGRRDIYYNWLEAN